MRGRSGLAEVGHKKRFPLNRHVSDAPHGNIDVVLSDADVLEALHKASNQYKYTFSKKGFMVSTISSAIRVDIGLVQAVLKSFVLICMTLLANGASFKLSGLGTFTVLFGPGGHRMICLIPSRLLAKAMGTDVRRLVPGLRWDRSKDEEDD
jgi:hypothetical protein